MAKKKTNPETEKKAREPRRVPITAAQREVIQQTQEGVGAAIQALQQAEARANLVNRAILAGTFEGDELERAVVKRILPGDDPALLVGISEPEADED